MQTFPLKFVLVGEKGVGKSQLSRRFVKGEFLADAPPTEGMEFSTKPLPFERCNLNAQIWDSAGKEHSAKKTAHFFKDAVGAILVFDLTNRETFERVKSFWFPLIKKFGHANISVILVGNKSDEMNTGKRQVSSEEAIEFAKENRLIGYVEVSALTGNCVDIAFRRVIFTVGGLLPSVKVHLDLLRLPFGWYVSGTESGNSMKASSSDGKLGSSRNKKEHDVVNIYTNYWNGETTRTTPTEPAEHGLLYCLNRTGGEIKSGSADFGSGSEPASPRNSSSSDILKPINQMEISSGDRVDSPNGLSDIPVKGKSACCVVS